MVSAIPSGLIVSAIGHSIMLLTWEEHSLASFTGCSDVKLGRTRD
jgi:hypothetical protein